jgi:hypothetical protein
MSIRYLFEGDTFRHGTEYHMLHYSIEQMKSEICKLQERLKSSEKALQLERSSELKQKIMCFKIPSETIKTMKITDIDQYDVDELRYILFEISGTEDKIVYDTYRVGKTFLWSTLSFIGPEGGLYYHKSMEDYKEQLIESIKSFSCKMCGLVSHKIETCPLYYCKKCDVTGSHLETDKHCRHCQMYHFKLDKCDICHTMSHCRKQHQCKYCKKFGHHETKCFKLFGKK